MSTPWYVPLIAALIGAMSAGVFQTVAGIFARRREKAATLVAIASEVQTLCTIIRDQRYLEEMQEIVRLGNQSQVEGGIARGPWRGEVLTADIRSNYFEVFSANASKLGTLDSQHAHDIVRFYSLCKSTVDSLRPDGILAVGGSLEEKLSAARSQERALMAILWLGDRIIQYPKGVVFEELDVMLAHPTPKKPA